MITKNVLLIIVFLSFTISTIAQTTAGDESDVQPRYIIDTPTAGLLHQGGFALDIDFFQQGGMLIGLSAGALERLNFGIAYGGSHIIGSDKIVWQKLPGVQLKFRLFDEGSDVMPAIALGFDSQGKEHYIDSTNRFTIKSRGFYATASKNYEFLGNLAFHGGINMSLERGDDDKDLNFFTGLEKSLGTDMSLLVEYDFAFNDNGPRSLGRGKGYLNAGLRWSFGNGFTLGIDLKNINRNQEIFTVGNRVIRIEYVRGL